MNELCQYGVLVDITSVGKYRQYSDILVTKSRSKTPALVNLLSQCNHYGPVALH